jgi:cyclohexanecarboxyl-CoA dehydrogenase
MNYGKSVPATSAGKKLLCLPAPSLIAGQVCSDQSKAVRMATLILLLVKTSISGGMQSDAVVTTAGLILQMVRRDNPFYVPLGYRGKSVFRMRQHQCWSGIPYLCEVRVPISFGSREREGFSKVMRSFDASRVLVGLSALALETSLTETVEYVKCKTAFSNPLSRFEAVSFKLAEHATLLEAARMICYKALKLRDEGLPHSKEAAMAKWFPQVRCAPHDLLLIFGHRGTVKRTH